MGREAEFTIHDPHTKVSAPPLPRPASLIDLVKSESLAFHDLERTMLQ